MASSASCDQNESVGDMPAPAIKNPVRNRGDRARAARADTRLLRNRAFVPSSQRAASGRKGQSSGVEGRGAYNRTRSCGLSIATASVGCWVSGVGGRGAGSPKARGQLLSELLVTANEGVAPKTGGHALTRNLLLCPWVVQYRRLAWKQRAAVWGVKIRWPFSFCAANRVWGCSGFRTVHADNPF